MHFPLSVNKSTNNLILSFHNVTQKAGEAFEAQPTVIGRKDGRI